MTSAAINSVVITSLRMKICETFMGRASTSSAQGDFFLASASTPLGRGFHDLHGLARNDAQLSFHNHPVPRLHRALDGGVHAIVVKHVHGTHLRAVAGADNEDVAG